MGVMQKIKIQHYVSRFYLKNFSKPQGENYIINCFDKSELKQFSADISNVGCEKYFYDIDRDTHQLVEKKLSEHEKEFSSIYNKLIERKNLACLDWKEKEIIAHFVATQEFRTREMKEMFRSIAKELKRWLSNKPLKKDLKRQLEEIQTEKGLKSIHLYSLVETLLGKSKLVDIVLQMKWILGESYLKMPFWTSDNPVCRFNPIDLKPYGNLGLLSRGIQVFFPLTPHLILVFCDPLEYILNPEKITCIKDNILFANTLQLGFCTRHIFSIDKDFSIAKKWLKEYPNSRDIKRTRNKAQF
jgi:hypothetical protein